MWRERIPDAQQLSKCMKSKHCQRQQQACHRHSDVVYVGERQRLHQCGRCGNHKQPDQNIDAWHVRRCPRVGVHRHHRNRAEEVSENEHSSTASQALVAIPRKPSLAISPPENVRKSVPATKQHERHHPRHGLPPEARCDGCVYQSIEEWSPKNLPGIAGPRHCGNRFRIFQETEANCCKLQAYRQRDQCRHVSCRRSFTEQRPSCNKQRPRANVNNFSR
mmetsp:Transcript_26939/g.51328  ORF Transcript_26939/g.51328 Transcript_26939/m.51328 type:complete len:220 (+) Transcript_26939:354-1013(+)